MSEEMQDQAQGSPIERKLLKLCTIGEFLEQLASDAVLPGAGAAGGIALALAAACASKAVAVTARHESGGPELKNLRLQFAHITETALVSAQQDALEFKQHLATGNAATNNSLLRTDNKILETCLRLDLLLHNNQSHIAESMLGDWRAAITLSRACRVIHQENVRELKTGKE